MQWVVVVPVAALVTMERLQMATLVEAVAAQCSRKHWSLVMLPLRLLMLAPVAFQPDKMAQMVGTLLSRLVMWCILQVVAREARDILAVLLVELVVQPLMVTSMVQVETVQQVVEILQAWREVVPTVVQVEVVQALAMERGQPAETGTRITSLVEVVAAVMMGVLGRHIPPNPAVLACIPVEPVFPTHPRVFQTMHRMEVGQVAVFQASNLVEQLAVPQQVVVDRMEAVAAVLVKVAFSVQRAEEAVEGMCALSTRAVTASKTTVRRPRNILSITIHSNPGERRHPLPSPLGGRCSSAHLPNIGGQLPAACAFGGLASPFRPISSPSSYHQACGLLLYVGILLLTATAHLSADKASSIAPAIRTSRISCQRANLLWANITVMVPALCSSMLMEPVCPNSTLTAAAAAVSPITGSGHCRYVLPSRSRLMPPLHLAPPTAS